MRRGGEGYVCLHGGGRDEVANYCARMRDMRAAMAEAGCIQVKA